MEKDIADEFEKDITRGYVAIEKLAVLKELFDYRYQSGPMVGAGRPDEVSGGISHIIGEVSDVLESICDGADKVFSHCKGSEEAPGAKAVEQPAA